MRRMGVVGAAMVLVLALGAGSASADKPAVLVFGDSILTQVQWNAEPLALLSSGFELRLDVAVCRTTIGESCPFEGVRPPTLDERIAELQAAQQLAPTVVIEGGYNDDPTTFAQGVEATLDELEGDGVQRILWATLKESRPQYPAMNAVLRAAARTHKELTIVDWDAYSHNQWSWFQSDAVHLEYPGAMGLAQLLHDQLREALAPPLRATLAKLRLRRGRAFSGRLVTGGIAPYALRIVAGRPPRGVHLYAGGKIDGVPRELGTRTFRLQIRDAVGKTVTAAIRVTVAP